MAEVATSVAHTPAVTAPSILQWQRSGGANTASVTSASDEAKRPSAAAASAGASSIADKSGSNHRAPPHHSQASLPPAPAHSLPQPLLPLQAKPAERGGSSSMATEKRSGATAAAASTTSPPLQHQQQPAISVFKLQMQRDPSAKSAPDDADVAAAAVLVRTHSLRQQQQQPSAVGTAPSTLSESPQQYFVSEPSHYPLRRRMPRPQSATAVQRAPTREQQQLGDSVHAEAFFNGAARRDDGGTDDTPEDDADSERVDALEDAAHAAAVAVMRASATLSDAEILRRAGIPSDSEEDHSLCNLSAAASSSSSSSSLAEDEARYAHFLSWMSRHGATFPNLTLRHYEKDYRGVHIREDRALPEAEHAATTSATVGKTEEEMEEKTATSDDNAAAAVTISTLQQHARSASAASHSPASAASSASSLSPSASPSPPLSPLPVAAGARDDASALAASAAASSSPAVPAPSSSSATPMSPIPKGSLLLSVPHGLLITVELARSSPIGAAISHIPSLGSQAILALYLIQEKFKQKQWEREQEELRRVREEALANVMQTATAVAEPALEEEEKSLPAAAPSGAPAPVASLHDGGDDDDINVPPPAAPSFWSPWLAVLPSSFDTLPLFFPPEDTRLLEGCTELLQKVAQQRRSMREEYAAIKAVLKGEYVRHVRAVEAWTSKKRTSATTKGSITAASSPPRPQPLIESFSHFLREFSYPLFVWGCLAVGTRVFSLQIGSAKTSVLAPLADMMNHAHASGTNWTYDGRARAFTLTSCIDLPPGAPVHESYGVKDNKRFLCSYGFCLGENAANEVAVGIQPDLVLDPAAGANGEEGSSADGGALLIAPQSSSSSSSLRSFTLRACWDHLGEDALNFLRIANLYEVQLAREQEEEELEQARRARRAEQQREKKRMQEEEEDEVLRRAQLRRRAQEDGVLRGEERPHSPTAEDDATGQEHQLLSEADIERLMEQRLFMQQQQQEQQLYHQQYDPYSSSSLPRSRLSAAAAGSSKPSRRRMVSPPSSSLRRAHSPAGPLTASGPISLDNELAALYTLRLSCRAQLKTYPTSLAFDAALLEQKEGLTTNQRNCITFRMGEKKILHYWIDLATLAIALLVAPYEEEGSSRSQRIHGNDHALPTLPADSSCKAKVRFLAATGSVEGILTPFAERRPTRRTMGSLSMSRATKRSASGEKAEGESEEKKEHPLTAGAAIPVSPAATPVTTNAKHAEYDEQKEPRASTPDSSAAAAADSAQTQQDENDADQEQDDEDDEFISSLSCPASVSLLLADLAASNGPLRNHQTESNGATPAPGQGVMSYISAVVVPLQQQRHRALLKRRKRKHMAMLARQHQHQQAQHMRLMRQRHRELMQQQQHEYEQHAALYAEYGTPPEHEDENERPSKWMQLQHLQHEDEGEGEGEDHPYASSYAHPYDDAHGQLVNYDEHGLGVGAYELDEHSHDELLDRSASPSMHAHAHGIRFHTHPLELEQEDADDGENESPEPLDDNEDRSAALRRAARRRHEAQMLAQHDAHLHVHGGGSGMHPYTEAELRAYYERRGRGALLDDDDGEDEDDEYGRLHDDYADASHCSTPLSDLHDDEEDEPRDDEDDFALAQDDDAHTPSVASSHRCVEDEDAGGHFPLPARQRRMHRLDHRRFAQEDDDGEEEEEDEDGAGELQPSEGGRVSAESSSAVRGALHQELAELQQAQEMQARRAELHSGSSSRRSRTDSAQPSSRTRSRVSFVRPGSAIGAAFRAASLRAQSDSTPLGLPPSSASSKRSSLMLSSRPPSAAASASRPVSRSASRAAALLSSYYDEVQSAQRERLLKSREGERDGEDSIRREEPTDEGNPLEDAPVAYRSGSDEEEEDHAEVQQRPSRPVSRAKTPAASAPVVAARPASSANKRIVLPASLPASSAAVVSVAQAHRPPPITVYHDASSTASGTAGSRPKAAASGAKPSGTATAASVPAAAKPSVPAKAASSSVAVKSVVVPKILSSTLSARSVVAAATVVHGAPANIAATQQQQRKKVLSASTPRVLQQAAPAAATTSPLASGSNLPPLSTASSPSAAGRFSAFPSGQLSARAGQQQRTPIGSVAASPLSATTTPVSHSLNSSGPLSPFVLSPVPALSASQQLQQSSPSSGSSARACSVHPRSLSSSTHLTPSPPPLASPLSPPRLLPSVCNAQGHAVSPSSLRPTRVASASAASTGSASSSVASSPARAGLSAQARLPQVLSPASALAAQISLARFSATTGAAPHHAQSSPPIIPHLLTSSLPSLPPTGAQLSTPPRSRRISTGSGSASASLHSTPVRAVSLNASPGGAASSVVASPPSRRQGSPLYVPATLPASLHSSPDAHAGAPRASKLPLSPSAAAATLPKAHRALF